MTTYRERLKAGVHDAQKIEKAQAAAEARIEKKEAASKK